MKSPLSRDNNEWRQCKSWLITQIHALQLELEKPNLPEREADVIRGRIAFARLFLKSVEPEVKIEQEQLEEPVLDRAVSY